MKKIMMTLALLLSLGSAVAAPSTTIKLDTRTKHDITASQGDTVCYDAAWAGAAKMRIYGGTELLAELTGEGEYTFSGVDSIGAYPVRLMSVDDDGNVIDTLCHVYARLRYPDEQQPAVPSSVEIISSKVRESDPTIIDTVYRVTSVGTTCDTRILAFQDGSRSFASVVRPVSFVDGTGSNIGDGVPANTDLTVSWQVSSDWSTDLAKVKIEILVKKDRLLPLGFYRVKDPETAKEYLVAKSTPSSTEVYDALMWLYADQTEGLTVSSGYLKNGSTYLASGTSISSSYSANATQYVIRQMGFTPLASSGTLRTLINSALRTTLTPSGFNQWACKEL